MEKTLEVLDWYLEDSIFDLYTIFVEQLQRLLPGN
jgi:hypothetical protein